MERTPETDGMNAPTTTIPMKPPTTVPKKPMFIVAEVSKNWPEDLPMTLISTKFETIINNNLRRGYTLVDWKYCSVATGSDRDAILETIIAVFKLT